MTKASPDRVEPAAPPAPPSSALRLPGFRLLFTAALVNNTGGEITLLAYPLVAVVLLHATVGQVGLLAAAGTLAFLVIGLPAGVWVDRAAERRRVLIAADLTRFVLLASVPVAWWLGRLSLAQLVAVAFLTGCCRVFFDVAAQSYLPGLVGPRDLVSANAALTGANSGSQIVGRALGGFLIQGLTGPVAMGVNALTALWSAGCVLLIRDDRPRSTATPGPVPLRQGIREGLRHVVRDPVLRPAAISSGLGNLFISINVTMLPVVLIRDVGLSEGGVGLFFSVAGVGSVLGAVFTPSLIRRFGYGRVLWLSAALCAPLYLLLPLADHGGRLVVAAGAFLVMNLRNMIGNIILVSYRQRVTPDHLLGRVNATMRFALWGMLPIGSGLSALIAGLSGARAALWVAAFGTALAWIPVALSPLSTMRELPPAPC